MKTFFIITCLGVFLCAACESQEQKTDESLERYKANKKQINAEIAYSKYHPQIEVHTKTKTIIIPSPIDERQTFTNDALHKIATNEKLLKQIKSNKNIGDKNFRKAMRAEKDNNNLRSSINEYQLQVKLLWDQYHKSLSDDMKKLDKDIIELQPK